MSALLWALLALFVARVAAQALVAFLGVLIVLMAAICLDFTRGRGFFVQPRRFFAVHWLWFGWIYLAAMLLRRLAPR